MQSPHSIIVKTHWIMKVFAVFGFIFFGWIIFVSILNHASIGTIAVLSLFTAGCVYLWVAASSFISIDEKEILVSVPRGRFRIGWNEVNVIETNGQMYAFIGQDKRVVISLTLASNTSQTAREFLLEQSRKLNIKVNDAVSVPLTHLNSKVK